MNESIFIACIIVCLIIAITVIVGIFFVLLSRQKDSNETEVDITIFKLFKIHIHHKNKK